MALVSSSLELLRTDRRRIVLITGEHVAHVGHCPGESIDQFLPKEQNTSDVTIHSQHKCHAIIPGCRCQRTGDSLKSLSLSYHNIQSRVESNFLNKHNNLFADEGTTILSKSLTSTYRSELACLQTGMDGTLPRLASLVLSLEICASS
ncbi:hypothetical protein M378DRAFT_719656 [Amanita muscaria Koide BX008]|uniref:Uncharacterized protein n=1 Tax=Amanita muscaria (strain Koide BX008) TaxID=946122 RepID=A0A0C2TRR7_AMAMK|nr:hypothetical protein M378DRAFT_719656 [Amanita muscaria Koide BX008]